LKAALEREAAERGVSRSEYIRSILADRHRVDELEERLRVREDRIEELERQLAERSEIEERIEDLPDKIRGNESYLERRQRVWDNGSPLQRLKWRVTGVPVDEPSDDG